MVDLFKFLIEAPEAVILLLYLVLPGYITVKVYDLLAPGERRSLGDTIIDILAWSFMLMLLWFWPFVTLYVYADSLARWLHYLIAFVLTILAVFVTPILAANLIYTVRHRNFIRGAAKGSSTTASPTSWDWFFSEKANNYYVRFHLKTGEKLGGYYGENSYATSFPHEQEVYIEEEWHLDEDGKFTEPIEGTKGALVTREDCSLVQFLEVREATGNRDGDQNHNGHDDQDGHKLIVEEPNTARRIHGEGYQSGKPNSPTRRPPGREQH
jgi:hypothetical protein